MLLTYPVVTLLVSHYDQRTLINDKLSPPIYPSIYTVDRGWGGYHVIYVPRYHPQNRPGEFSSSQVCERLEKLWSEVTDFEE